jgi:hypothetical protein
MAVSRTGLSNPTITVNNVAVSILPNTFKYNEGLGQAKVRAESAGGGAVTTVYSQDVSTKIGKCQWEMSNTPSNIEAVRGWKTNANQNAITATDGTFSRSFAGAVVVNDYVVEAGVDGKIQVEWESAPAT